MIVSSICLMTDAKVLRRLARDNQRIPALWFAGDCSQVARQSPKGMGIGPPSIARTLSDPIQGPGADHTQASSFEMALKGNRESQNWTVVVGKLPTRSIQI